MTEIQGVHGSDGILGDGAGEALTLEQVAQTLRATLGPVGEVLAGIAPALAVRAAKLPDFGNLVESGGVLRLPAARINPIDVGVDPEVANLESICSSGVRTHGDRLGDEIMKSTLREEK